MWPAMQFCLDLSESVRVLSKFLKNPRPTHVELAKHILGYISGTLELELTFDDTADTLDDVIKYIDSDFAGSKSD